MYETLSPQEVCSRLQGDLRKGLTREEAARRCRENGKNELKEKRRRTAVEAFFLQLNDPLIYVLLAAAGISVFLGEISDAVIIGAVVTMNALVGDPGGKGPEGFGFPEKAGEPKGPRNPGGGTPGGGGQ